MTVEIVDSDSTPMVEANWDPWKGNILCRPQELCCLTRPEIQAEFISPGEDVWVQEIVDGTSVGFSCDDAGRLVVQNKSQVLNTKKLKKTNENPTSPYNGLYEWILANRRVLEPNLWPHIVIFGQWCKVTRDIYYSALPDYFIVESVYDRDVGKLLTGRDAEEFCQILGYSAAPGSYDRIEIAEDITSALKYPSLLGDGPSKGLYIFKEERYYFGEGAYILNPEVSHTGRVSTPVKFNQKES